MLGSGGCIPGDPAFLAALRAADDGDRRGADLRRGDDVAPRRRRRPGAARHHAGHDDARQVPRRRAVVRRVRRPRRPDGGVRPGRAAGSRHGGTFNNNAFTMAVGAAVADDLVDADGARRASTSAATACAPGSSPLRRRRRCRSASTGWGSLLRVHPVRPVARRPTSTTPTRAGASCSSTTSSTPASTSRRVACWRCRWTSPTTTPDAFLDAVEQFCERRRDLALIAMAATPVELSAAQARRMALAAQGFADRRPTGRVDRRHLRKVFDRIDVIQVDSVNVLVRSQELPLFARLGPHPRTLLADAARRRRAVRVLGPHGGDRAERASTGCSAGGWTHDHQWQAVERARRSDARATSTRSSTASATTGRSPPPTSSSGSARRARGGAGTTARSRSSTCSTAARSSRVRRRSDFARLYDLPERVLPAAALDAPTPTGGRGPQGAADARRPQRSAWRRSRTSTDYHRQGTPAVQAARRRARRGRASCCRPTVEGWTEAGVRPPRRHGAAARSSARALLSPFDSLVWNRDRTERLFDFHYRIEIYTPAPKRIYGYYVLPFLLGDRSSAASTSRPTGPPACCASRAPTSSRASTRADVAGTARRGAALDGGLARARRRRRDRRAASSRRRCGASGVAPLDVEAARLRPGRPRYAPHVSTERRCRSALARHR